MADVPETKKKKKKIILCPECDTEVDIDTEDECSECGLNVKMVIEKDRYERALQTLRDRREAETGGKKKKKPLSFNPFA